MPPVHGIGLARRVLRLAAAPAYERRLRRRLRREGVVRAVAARDTAALFAWLADALSFQGVANAVAAGYLARHGSVTLDDLGRALAPDPPPCPRLASVEALRGCGYRKLARTCAEPGLLPACPLPRHPLRNGRLNRMAYGLALTLRDTCGGDLVGWLDAALAAADRPDGPERLPRLRAAVLGPLLRIPGAGDKVLAMALADLLTGADPRRPLWVEVGRGLVAVDTLVHAFLHRTGLLARNGAAHGYGPACHRPGGCADLLRALAAAVDAREVDPAFPACYPRLLQHAVWRYCAAGGLDVCNGRRIDDRAPCGNRACALRRCCARLPLRPPRPREAGNAGRG